MLAGPVDVIEAFGLLRRHPFPPQDAGHAEDAVHRGANFVAHVGQEGTLGQVGGFGEGACLGELCGAGGHQFLQMVAVALEFFAEPLLFGDVTDVALDHPGVAGQIDVADEFHVSLLPLRGFQRQVVVAHIFLLLQIQEFFLVCRNVLEEAQVPDVLLPNVIERVAQHLGDEWIRVNDHARLGVQDQNAVLRSFEQASVTLFQRLRSLARGVVGADQQVADDGLLLVTQRRDRHHRREAAAVLADLGQFVDVLDAARGLEHQGLEARPDSGSEFDAQGRGAGDQFLWIRDVGRRDLVHHLGGGVAQHALRADVEELDDTLGVGGNT